MSKMRRTTVIMAAATLGALLTWQSTSPAAAANPSFACNGRLLPTEAVICSDDGLASFDRQLAAIYDGRLKSLPAAQQAEFNSMEKAWLAKRNSCGAKTSCIINAYQVRMGELGGPSQISPPIVAQNQPAPPQAPAPQTAAAQAPGVSTSGTSAWLGVRVQSMTPTIPERFFKGRTLGVVVIEKPYPDSPAAAAGIEVGDVITAINDQSIRGATDLTQSIGSMVPGTSVLLTIISHGEAKTLSVKLGELPEAQAGKPQSSPPAGEAQRAPAQVPPQVAPVTDCDRYAGSDLVQERKPALTPFDDLINPALAVPACEDAVRQFPNSPRLTFQLGYAHYKANNFTAALEQFRKAADQGEAMAQDYLGLMYGSGRGVPQDLRQAVDWYRKSADQGVAAAQYNLGSMYQNGEGVPKNMQQAVAWYRKAADQGWGQAQTSLGSMYQNGEGVPKDMQQAVAWYRKAADQGVVQAQYELGLAYETGGGVPQDNTQAVAWYRRAAGQGFKEAKTKLDGLAETERRKSADQGSAEAQYALGYMYQHGQGMPIDYQQALNWYRKAADQGWGQAQTSLGYMYGNGQGVLKDDKQAVAWYRKAADHGVAEAQRTLGLLYTTGQDGLNIDYQQALAWYRKAAEQGSMLAQYALGYMYDNGQGVPKDGQQAVAWYRKAAEQGQPDAKMRLNQLENSGGTGTQELPQTQMAAAAVLMGIVVFPGGTSRC